MKKSAFRTSIGKSIVIGLFIFSVYYAFSSWTIASDFLAAKTIKLDSYGSIAQEFLGFNGPKRVLVLFQNNAEQRYGGGFIGTVGYLEIDKGKIRPQFVKSVYNYDWGVDDPVDYTAADGSRYTLRDSGQNLDWNNNAKRAKEIFEKRTNKKVDAVVAITPEVLKYLIKKTGPVKLNDYGVTVTDANITETIQTQVEYGRDKVSGKDPKTIISELANVLITRLSEKGIGELQTTVSGLRDLLQQRQVLLYSPDYKVATSLKSLGFDGSLVNFNSDYMLISENNTSVDKSSAFLKRSLNRSINISNEGLVRINATISREQTMPVSFPYVDPNTPGGETFLIKQNISEIKIAIPRGSKIIQNESDTELSSVGREGNYDVYSFVSSLDPLVRSDYKITYELPFKLVGDMPSYNSYLQFQNGGWPYSLSTEISVPASWQLVASNQLNIVKSKDGNYTFDKKINKDQTTSLVFIK